MAISGSVVRGVHVTALSVIVLGLVILALFIPTTAAAAALVSLFGGSVGRNADGRLEAFSASGDGTIYHNYQRSGGGWDGWSSLGKPA